MGTIVHPCQVSVNDLNLSSDYLAILTNIGETICEQVKIRWKNATFGVWVKEEQGDWVPDFLLRSASVDVDVSSPAESPVNSSDPQQSRNKWEVDGFHYPRGMGETNDVSKDDYSNNACSVLNNDVCGASGPDPTYSPVLPLFDRLVNQDGLEEGEIPSLAHLVKPMDSLVGAATAKQFNGQPIDPCPATPSWAHANRLDRTFYPDSIQIEAGHDKGGGTVSSPVVVASARHTNGSPIGPYYSGNATKPPSDICPGLTPPLKTVLTPNEVLCSLQDDFPTDPLLSSPVDSDAAATAATARLSNGVSVSPCPSDPLVSRCKDVDSTSSNKVRPSSLDCPFLQEKILAGCTKGPDVERVTRLTSITPHGPTVNYGDDPFSLGPIIDEIMGHGNYSRVKINLGRKATRNNKSARTTESKGKEVNTEKSKRPPRSRGMGDCRGFRLSKQLLFQSRGNSRTKNFSSKSKNQPSSTSERLRSEEEVQSQEQSRSEEEVQSPEQEIGACFSEQENTGVCNCSIDNTNLGSTTLACDSCPVKNTSAQSTTTDSALEDEINDTIRVNSVVHINLTEHKEDIKALIEKEGGASYHQ